MSVKNIFIYNAQASDHITVEGRTVKSKGAGLPKKDQVFCGLRVSFAEDYAMAVATGQTDSLYAVHLNMDHWRGQMGESLFPIYGRRGSVKIDIS